ncbi:MULTISPECIES: hypothetical protein [Lactococcus]|uniref:hypothetical protein n=1 Tax=Lactococcus TaxID=1357 RepID=UPI00163DDE1E|nr:hypothetical protein [Lactococcus lactis]
MAPELLEAKRKWKRVNLSRETIFDLVDQIPDKSSEVKAKSPHFGKNLQKLGK